MGSPQCPPDADNPLPLNISVENWHLAERTTDCIIRKIQPTKVSEERRKHVIEYIQKLVRGCLGYEIYPFGSVPLITYLPDGDIDLIVLGPPNSEDFLSSNVRAILEAEEWNNDGNFEVKDVQCIQAEVKLVKCIVQNVVVDISFNSIGGLCTLCFLDEVDSMIGKDHLFKRTIILIKAWCYYESRILGAHHNLISTYALETLILYIFHLFHSYLHDPLVVLYKFLDYFNKFDWANLCVSLRGPVLLSSLPEIVVEVPENGGDNLLFSSDFLDQCAEKYSIHYRASENNRFFAKKYLNILDPLKENNNLGRSVSKGNLYRIRSAFAYGARKLGKILLSSEENMPAEIKNFFKNTLQRHENGERPDVQDLYSYSTIEMTDTNQSGGNGGIGDLSDSVIISYHKQYHIEEEESEFKDENTVLGFHMFDSSSRFENEVSLSSPLKAICTSHLHCSNGQIAEENENGNAKEIAAAFSNCLDSSLSKFGETESSANITKNFCSNLRSSSSDMTCQGGISHALENEESSAFVECIQGDFDVADLAGNHEVHLNNLRYAQCSYDFMNKSLSIGNVTPYSHYPIHGKMIRPPINGFFSGPPFPKFIPMNQCFVPHPLGLDDMRNRGTGTYIPLMNQNGFSKNPTIRRVRNHQFPSNHIARSQSVGQAIPVREYNMTDVSCFSVFNGNGHGKHGQIDHQQVSSGPFSSRFPVASGKNNNHPLENQLKFGSLDAIDSPTMGNGGKIKGSTPPHIHSPGLAVSTSPLSQRSEITPNSERSTQSYHLKDDGEFPPLAGGGNQTVPTQTQLNETKSVWEASRR